MYVRIKNNEYDYRRDKSVSIYQWMRENNFGDGVKKGTNIFYCSPLRSESTPSFVVNTKQNCGMISAQAKAVILSTLSSSLTRDGQNTRFWAILRSRSKNSSCCFNEEFQCSTRRGREKPCGLKEKERERREAQPGNCC